MIILSSILIYADVTELAVFSRAPPVEDEAKAKKTQRSKSFHAPSEKRFWAPQVSRGHG